MKLLLSRIPSQLRTTSLLSSSSASSASSAASFFTLSRSISFVPLFSLSSFSFPLRNMSTSASTGSQLTDADFKAKLDQQEYAVLRLAHTERPFSSHLYKESSEGIYKCKACEQPLYSWKTKFDAGCGWPAFYQALPNAIIERQDGDRSGRIEVLCSNCKSHLGHRFDGEKYNTPTDQRHCINGVCLTLDKNAK